MAFTHTITGRWQSSGRSIEYSHDHSGEGQVSISDSIADSTTDQEYAIAIDVTQIKALYISSDQAITIETNNGTTPSNTITLVANVPYIYFEGDYNTCLLTVDVTSLFVTNASGSTAVLSLECVYDATP